MNILLIILAIIGLLKLVSLFIVCIIEIYYRIIKVHIFGIIRECGIYKDKAWYIIPTIKVYKYDKYFEIMIGWLCFMYYNCYNINKDDDEK